MAAAHDTVLVLDFGSQYSQLIARRVREAKVYCELVPGTVSADEVRRRNPRGLVFSGGPASVYEEGAPRPDPAIYELGLPILGICYGMQLLAQDLGGAVEPATRREYGLASLVVDEAGGLFERLPAELPVWMSHGDVITRLPPGFRAVAHSLNSPCAAMAGPAGRLGIQFHPEVVHTPLGREVLRNFLYRVCGCSGTWSPRRSSTWRCRMCATVSATGGCSARSAAASTPRWPRPWCTAPSATSWSASSSTTACFAAPRPTGSST